MADVTPQSERESLVVEPFGAVCNAYKFTVWFNCAPEDFDALHDKAMDAVTAALGCTDDKDHDCPHFQFAAARPVHGSRRWAIRCALRELWAAAVKGELS